MNGLSAHPPPVGVPLTTHGNPGGAPRISPALLRGAKELSAIFEQRTAKLKGEYEEKIRVLTQERDAALSQASPGRTQDSDSTRAAEVVALRAERDQLLQERVQREQERVTWERERVQWERERSQWQEERARWEQEHKRGQEQLMKWAEEKNAIAKERRALEQQVQALDKEKEELKERIKSMIAPAVRVQDVEMAQDGGDSLGEVNANQRHESAIEAFPTHSPARSTTLPTLASSSTLSTLKSPSQEPVPMQVRDASPPLLPLPFDDFLINLSPTLDNSTFEPLLGLQLDPSDPLPAPPVQGSASPLPPSSLSTAGDSSPHLSSAVGGASALQTAATTSRSPRWKLVIKIPPSNEPPRKQIKPPLTPPHPEENMEVIHWPRPPPSDDEGGAGEGSVNDLAAGSEMS